MAEVGILWTSSIMDPGQARDDSGKLSTVHSLHCHPGLDPGSIMDEVYALTHQRLRFTRVAIQCRSRNDALSSLFVRSPLLLTILIIFLFTYFTIYFFKLSLKFSNS